MIRSFYHWKLFFPIVHCTLLVNAFPLLCGIQIVRINIISTTASVTYILKGKKNVLLMLKRRITFRRKEFFSVKHTLSYDKFI